MQPFGEKCSYTKQKVASLCKKFTPVSLFPVIETDCPEKNPDPLDFVQKDG
jgi:hypothetical protein